MEQQEFKTKAVLWLRKATDQVGTIKIRVKLDYKRYKYTDLNLPPCPTNLWDKVYNRVKPCPLSVYDYNQANTTIEKGIIDCKNDVLIIEPIKTVIEQTNNNLLTHVDKYVSQISNKSSRLVYQTAINRLHKYLNSVKLTNLNLSELTPEILREYKNYLELNLSPSTSKQSLQLFRQIIENAIDTDIVTYPKNPFRTIKHKSNIQNTTIKQTLTSEQIERFSNVNTETAPYLEVSKYAALFQLAAFGLRVSDLLTIRLSALNLKSNTLIVRTFKTGKILNIPVSDNLLFVLFMCYQSAPSIQKDISHCIALYESILSDNPNDNQNKELFTRTILDPFKNALSGYIKDNSNEFVFPYLNSKDFTKGLIISKNLDENQTRLLHNARKVYNDHLNKLAEMAEIDIKLTSHVWRHTHAMQMVSNQSFSLTDISATLGHSTERTTRIYISQFPQARMAEISKRISTDNPIY